VPLLAAPLDEATDDTSEHRVACHLAEAQQARAVYHA
jgi:hypothetical protein